MGSGHGASWSSTWCCHTFSSALLLQKIRKEKISATLPKSHHFGCLIYLRWQVVWVYKSLFKSQLLFSATTPGWSLFKPNFLTFFLHDQVSCLTFLEKWFLLQFRFHPLHRDEWGKWSVSGPSLVPPHNPSLRAGDTQKFKTLIGNGLTCVGRYQFPRRSWSLFYHGGTDLTF